MEQEVNEELDARETELMEQANASLCPPWVEYFNKLNCLFGDDPEIKLEQDFDKREIRMYIESTDKAQALGKLLPGGFSYGTERWHLAIIPANETRQNPRDLLLTALEGNPNFCGIIDYKQDAIDRPFVYMMFAKKVAQYYNDNLEDANGMRSTLYSKLAKELFLPYDPTIKFCTMMREAK